jgi:hypothetical protein
VACPSLPVRFIQPHPIETAARVCFEIAHDSFRRSLRIHYRMHVIASHMRNARNRGPPADSSHDARTPPESLPVPHRDESRPGGKEPDPSVPPRRRRALDLLPGAAFQAHCARGRWSRIRCRGGGTRSR